MRACRSAAPTRGAPRARRRARGWRGRSWSSAPRGRRGAGKGERSEAPVARVEVVEGRGQIGGGEVRPHGRHEAELGIGAFPEEEIAQALLASGADEQVDVGRARPAVGLAEARGEGLARLGSGEAPPRGAQDHVARRVVHGQTEVEAARARRLALGAGDRGPEGEGEAVAAPDEREADIMRGQRGGLAAQERAQERHERVHLRPRPLPVVGGEGEEGEGADPEPGRGFHDPAGGADPATVAGQASQAAGFRPPAVAVHDDGHVEPARGFLIKRTLHHEVSPQKKVGQWPSVLRVARISASMWLRYRASSRRPRGARRYSVRGRRPSKLLVQTTCWASSSLRQWTERLPSVVLRSALSSLNVSESVAASALTIPRRS